MSANIVPGVAMLKSSVAADSIHLIAVDIDGTLLNPQFQISPTDLAALRDAHAQGIEVISDTPQHPHNGFLKALVEQGPLGGCGYLLYVVTFLRCAGQAVRTSSDSSVRWVNGTIAGAGVSLFTQELFDANLSIGGSSLAILFAAFLSLQVCSLKGPRPTRLQFRALTELPC